MPDVTLPSDSATLVVHGSKTRRALEAFLRREPGGNGLVVLQIDHRIDASSAPAGTVLRTFESYLTEADLERIDSLAAEFASTWYRLRGRDITQLNGISAGACSELDAFFRSVILLKNLECATRALDADGIGRVVLGEGVSVVRWAWEAAARRRNIQVVVLPVDDPPALNWRRPTPSLLALVLRRVGGLLRGAAAAVVPRSTRADAPKFVARAGATVIAVVEGRATCDPWLLELRQAPDLQVERLKPDELRGSVWAKLASLRCFLTYVARRRDLQKNPCFRYGTTDLWDYWQPWVRSQFLDGFPSIHWQGRAFLAWLRRVKPRALVVPWHELSPVAFEAAERLGVVVVALQDSWLPGGHFPAGYRRFVRCHHLMVWGEISASWAVGIQGVRVHSVGHPGAGHGRRASPLPEPGRAEAAHPKKVVLAHQCWGPWSAFHSPLDTNDLWSATAEAARACPDVLFVGKIHPLVDHPNHEWPGRSQEIMDFAAEQRLPNFSVAPLDSSVGETLEQASLLLTYYSLTAVEALLSGVPVAMVNLTAKRDLFPELTQLAGAPAVRTTEELIALVRSLPSGPYTGCDQREDLAPFYEKVFGRPVKVASLISQILAARGSAR